MEFDFKTELHLLKLLGIKAKNVEELYEQFQDIPLSSVYYHTHRFLKQHHYLSPEPPNDFAYWIKNTLNIKDLSEAIASIDTIKYLGLKELKNEISLILEDYLKKTNIKNDCQKGDEFHFISCQTFVLPTGYKAKNLQEFYETIKLIDIGSIYFHIFEAKLRLKKDENDFQAWLNQIGENTLSKQFINLDPYNITLENLRKKILKIIEKRL